MTDSNIPPSQMIRVPTPLVDAVRELSRLHRAGHTRAVLAKLQRLIADVDSVIDSSIGEITDSVGDSVDSEVIAKLISSQMEAMREQIEQHINECVQAAVEQEVSPALGEFRA